MYLNSFSKGRQTALGFVVLFLVTMIVGIVIHLRHVVALSAITSSQLASYSVRIVESQEHSNYDVSLFRSDYKTRRMWLPIAKPMRANTWNELKRRIRSEGYPKFNSELHQINYEELLSKKLIVKGEEVFCARQIRRRQICHLWSRSSEEIKARMTTGNEPPGGRVLQSRDLTRWRLGVRFGDDDRLKRKALLQYLDRHRE